MLSIGELSLFLTEDLYLIKGEELSPVSLVETLAEDSSDPEDQVPVPIEPVERIIFQSVLFIHDKELSGVSAETFNNLVTKGLALQEKDYTLITEEKVTFSNPEEINSKKIILFGTTFTGFSQKYKIHTSGSQLILLADSMDRISANQELKKQLWAQLQLMFPK